MNLRIRSTHDTMAERIGGLQALHARADTNARVAYDWVARASWIAPLATDPATYSNTGVCLVIADPDVLARGDVAVSASAAGIVECLDREGVALDIGAYRDAPADLRIWCGATVETADLQAPTPWLDWAFEAAKREGHG